MEIDKKRKAINEILEKYREKRENHVSGTNEQMNKWGQIYF